MKTCTRIGFLFTLFFIPLTGYCETALSCFLRQSQRTITFLPIDRVEVFQYFNGKKINTPYSLMKISAQIQLGARQIFVTNEKTEYKYGNAFRTAYLSRLNKIIRDVSITYPECAQLMMAPSGLPPEAILILLDYLEEGRSLRIVREGNLFVAYHDSVRIINDQDLDILFSHLLPAKIKQTWQKRFTNFFSPRRSG